jgi:hypothetical protein
MRRGRDIIEGKGTEEKGRTARRFWYIVGSTWTCSCVVWLRGGDGRQGLVGGGGLADCCFSRWVVAFPHLVPEYAIYLRASLLGYWPASVALPWVRGADLVHVAREYFF